MNILIVKLSSLGDVLHTLPIVWDVRAKYPDARVDWAVEEAYVELLQPLQRRGPARGIDRAIPVCLRRLKRNFSHDGFVRLEQMHRALRLTEYDLIIDTQGLIKSAAIGRLARRSGSVAVVGAANRVHPASYEPLARWFYTDAVPIAPRTHAVDQSRRVAAVAIGHPSDCALTPPRFYDRQATASLLDAPCPLRDDFSRRVGRGGGRPYALCIHSTARTSKRWGNSSWVALGRELSRRGMTPVFLWGSRDEKTISDCFASEVPGAVVPRLFSLKELFSVVGNAQLAVGVDTGLIQLSAVLGKPTIAIYCASPRWRSEPYWSPLARAVGDTLRSPSVNEVLLEIDATFDVRPALNL